MAASTRYITRPIVVPSLLEAVRLRAKRTGLPESEVAKRLGERVYDRWLSEIRRSKARKE